MQLLRIRFKNHWSNAYPSKQDQYFWANFLDEKRPYILNACLPKVKLLQVDKIYMD